MIKSVVLGAGHGLPSRKLTNHDLEKMVDTSDAWIMQRTGIRERLICTDEEAASDLAIKAARQAVERANVDPSELDQIIVATVSGDYSFPSCSVLVQEKLGARNAAAYDVGAACAGFIYALSIADAILRSRSAKTVLVIGVDTLSKFTDWTDRSTCVLFGDAAGALVLRAEENTERGIIDTVLFSDGSGAPHIMMEAGGSRFPPTSEAIAGISNKIYMNGNETYKFAVKALGEACCKVIEKANLSVEDIDLFVPHQANVRIIDAAAERIGLPREKIFLNIEKYGNTSAGSIPLGLYEAELEGRLKPGSIVLTVGFGAGLVWGANLIRW